MWHGYLGNFTSKLQPLFNPLLLSHNHNMYPLLSRNPFFSDHLHSLIAAVLRPHRRRRTVVTHHRITTPSSPSPPFLHLYRRLTFFFSYRSVSGGHEVVGEEKEGESVCRREIIESEENFFLNDMDYSCLTLPNLLKSLIDNFISTIKIPSLIPNEISLCVGIGWEYYKIQQEEILQYQRNIQIH
ncbi:hypothetical protein MtrunA17_Chr7g0262701 [Medicago truncatula]|uniref:Uncharacterized protein n=1 Tax=Medicago truncatula TaxID=3880 RepID=A0A396HBL6_MEDTR|nr:hypothetical protein MtrunA17_Chr7g0262701 [Medicago truncatula]